MSNLHSNLEPTSFASPYSSSAKIDVIDPFNEKDLTHLVTANEKLDSADIAKEARFDPRTRELLIDCNNYVNNEDMPENTSYHPFCELANHILHEITNDKPNIPFWHIKGHNVNRRVPDVVCVSDGQWKKIKNGPPHSFKRHDKPNHVGDESLDPPQPAPELTVPSAPLSLSHSTSEWAGAWIQNRDKKFGNMTRKPPTQHQSENNKRSKLRSRKAAIRRDCVEQNCRYVCELMSMVETGTHDISTLVSGFHIWMYYYLNTLNVEDRRLRNKGTRCDFEAAGRTFNLTAPLHWKLSRGTRAYRAQEGGVARDFAIKHARSTRKRRSEAVGRYLKELAEDANFRAKHDVGYSDTYYLPSVLFSEDQELKYSFRELVPDLEYENRVRRCFRKSFPDLQTDKHRNFVKAFRDIFQVLHLSWEKKIAHRGTSFGNIMFYRGADGEFVCSAVNDLNLAKVDGVYTESLFRTGTRAFLARDLLKTGVNTLHIERFDWESALYVLIWITTRYEDGEEKYTNVLTEWFDLKDANASNAKSTYIDHFEERPELKTFKLLELHWIHPWTELFRNGFQARTSHIARRRKATSTNESFEDETLGSHVTYENIWDILKQDLVEDDS